jgi:hypothetical protein
LAASSEPFAGVAYARGILHLLTTVWREAVGTSSLAYHAQPQTYFIGIFASVIVAAITIAIVLRKQAKQPAYELLARGAERTFSVTARRPRWTTIIGIVSAFAALGIVGWALATGHAAGPVFFGAGAMLLIAGICAAAVVLNQPRARRVVGGAVRIGDGLAQLDAAAVPEALRRWRCSAGRQFHGYRDCGESSRRRH